LSSRSSVVAGERQWLGAAPDRPSDAFAALFPEQPEPAMNVRGSAVPNVARELHQVAKIISNID
jgi:hypothetical protein